jgi:anaerobic selenocysteine-containing dehydrogenase
LIEAFLKAFGAPPSISFAPFDEAVLRRANELSFGWPQMPTFDLARANYVMVFGADFLGTWNSPVAQSVAYGIMRQGRPGSRGKFVMVEPRMSQTGANADEWLPAQMGTEGIVALGIAHVILKEKLRASGDAAHAGSLIAGWDEGLPDYTSQAVESSTGIPATTVMRLGREMASHAPAVAIIGGTPLAQTNGLFSALAVNALNALLGSVEKPGGLLFTPPLPIRLTAPGGRGTPPASFANIRTWVEKTPGLQALLLYEANPVFACPARVGVREALEKIPFIASFGNFIDETSVLADLILPDHSPLESWLDSVPESGAPEAVVSLAAPALHPLHTTRSMPDVLLDVAHQLGGPLATALPHKTFEEMLRAAYTDLEGPRKQAPKETAAAWDKINAQGGWWSAEVARPIFPADSASHPPSAMQGPEFDGAEKDFPLHFLPYPSQMLLDGSLAHLPWLQETPDPVSTAMWGTWVEINPRTAAQMGIRLGDLVEVTSQHGSLRAPALISPGIAPDAVAMPVGQGHEHFGRYASGRGANPLAILAPMIEPETGALAWAATRVRISRSGQGKLALFAGGLREHPQDEGQR